MAVLSNSVDPVVPTSPSMSSNVQLPKSTDSPRFASLYQNNARISGIRRVQSEGYLPACRNVAQLLTVDGQADSPVMAKSEHVEKYDRTSKRRAFTFAGDDFDSLTCGNDDEDVQPPVLTEENLRQASDLPSAEENVICRSPSGSNGWTWAWGTLPIKATDPSIADLQSLTDLALKERFSTQSFNTSTGDPNYPQADGKPAVILHPARILPSVSDEREYRPVPIDSKSTNVEFNKENQLEDMRASAEIPEPKYSHSQQSQLSRIRSHTFSDDYRHTSASPGLRDQSSGLQDKALLESSSVPQHISARAASIASALGSERILSLCAHILSSENYPRTEEALFATLNEHAVSPKAFSDNPLDILNNPNLVVVANNLLIPWRLVHAHLTTLPSNQRDTQSHENLTVPANEQSNLWWAGRLITSWNTSVADKNLTDNTAARSIRSVSRSGSALSTSIADGKTESRRNSYSNPEEEDFDHFECMSEGSSAGPSWSQAISGHPALDMDTPGAHLWNKETLNWNSADDFQRLLNEYTSADAVPDLLKPYINYSNIWPTGEIEDGDLQAKISQNLSSPKFSINSPTLISSTSHDSGLAMIAKNIETKILPVSPEEVSKIDTIGSPPLNILPDGKSKTMIYDTDDNEALQEEEVVEFLSLEDISPDEILPGPAREVYDGSDTDSFYSLSLDDETSSHTSGQTGQNNPDRKYRYRKTLIPTQDQIKLMDLQDGMNEINFEVEVIFFLNIFYENREIKSQPISLFGQMMPKLS